MSQNHWLGKLTKLNKARNNAPHKPLLLLVVLELAEKKELPHGELFLTPELAFRFATYFQIVAYRRTQRPDVRMPFHHLKTQGFWSAHTEAGEPSKHRSVTRYVVPDSGFVDACANADFRTAARRILIAEHFEPAERNALYTLVGLEIPPDDVIAKNSMFEAPDDASRAGRDGRFRLDVASAYNYACALTGYRVNTISGGSIVDAAHIHQFADSRNNNPKNGMALSKNAHWLFDAGLWSIDDDYRVIVAATEFSESSPDHRSLIEYSGEPLRLPTDDRLWPDQRHCRWHRKNKFVGG